MLVYSLSVDLLHTITLLSVSLIIDMKLCQLQRRRFPPALDKIINDAGCLLISGNVAFVLISKVSSKFYFDIFL